MKNLAGVCVFHWTSFGCLGVGNRLAAAKRHLKVALVSSASKRILDSSNKSLALFNAF